MMYGLAGSIRSRYWTCTRSTDLLFEFHLMNSISLIPISMILSTSAMLPRGGLKRTPLSQSSLGWTCASFPLLTMNYIASVVPLSSHISARRT
ncbi:hypothetical protein F5Y05DRAFT_287555 [Hypoxylon sp. FL0543]|nr:hypothetical protein F5Y05DRAFT_287555 [Hypoxylon sp. FL0543]